MQGYNWGIVGQEVEKVLGLTMRNAVNSGYDLVVNALGDRQPMCCFCANFFYYENHTQSTQKAKIVQNSTKLIQSKIASNSKLACTCT